MKHYLLVSAMAAILSSNVFAEETTVSETVEEVMEEVSTEAAEAEEEVVEAIEETAEATEEAMEETEETMTEEVATTSGVNMGGAKYSCENAGNIRRVEIDYENTDATVPCTVNYYKDNEAPGETTTLWQAQNSEGYCEAKAAEFVEKLRSWGWDCNEA